MGKRLRVTFLFCASRKMETKYRKTETYAFIAILATETKASWNGIEVPFQRIFAPSSHSLSICECVS